MLDLQLVYEGGGRFHTASKLDLRLSEDKLGAGEIVEAQVGKRRSSKQHRWVFAMVAAAFDNQTAGPLFDDAERLRKWLLIQAGHCDVKRFDPGAVTPAVAQWLRDTYGDIDFTTDGRWIYAKTAKSIAYAECDHDAMCRIADAMIEVIVEKIVPGSRREDWEPYVNERHAEIGQHQRARRASRAGVTNAAGNRHHARNNGEQHPRPTVETQMENLTPAGV